MSFNSELQSNNVDLRRILDAVNSLPESSGDSETIEPVIEALNVVQNGTYTVPEGVHGYSPVSVNVPIPDGYIKPTGSLTITENGSYDVTDKADVDVLIEIEPIPPTLQEKTVSPTTSSQSVTPDSGYDGLSKVTVNAMPTATQATPSITVSSAGLITASATQTAGYVTAGTKSATKQLTTQAAKTITPSTSSQTAVASGTYTTGAITVAAIPSNYEDVGTETDAYTAKIALLETAVTTLETELSGKASGSGSQSSEDLDAELTQQENLIAQLSTILDNKAAGGSGGGSVETCTITVNSFAANIRYTIYTAYEDGNYVYHQETYSSSKSSVVLNNVLVGCTVEIGSTYNMCSFTLDTHSNYIYYNSGFSSALVVPIGDITITVYDDD